MFLTKEQILGIQDIKFEEVDIPEWGGKIRVKVMNGTERSIFDSTAFPKQDNGTDQASLRGLLVALTVVDAEGKKLFTPAEAALLNEKSAVALDAICEVAMQLNKLLPEALEKTRKNLPETPSAGSITASA